ncbi:MAG: FtsX-like permease family protein [Anaerolineae bacterium]|nr:FtsX-like permease family protein [Anaerolineae bacterium]MCA9886880.1 FtsX-like permease family protein [Anaerolineae bacterium]MCA9891373.1 FtsX-like permease family protein [Anaerolineae bacterium]
MAKLAWRNLTQQPLRFAISAGGVALAVVLILAMSGVFAGSEEHAVLYMRNQPAELLGMQAGVSNLHMSSSILSEETVQQIQQFPGVEQAIGVLYASAGVDVGETEIYSYVIGIDPNAPYGGPWSLVEGNGSPGLNEIVIDRDLAYRYGLTLGDTVSILGYPLTITGLSEGTFGIATNVVFVNKTAMALLMDVSPQSASYVLIEPETDTNVNSLENALNSTIRDANIMSRANFIASDQEMIRQMGADILQMMNVIAYIIGLLIIGITVYTATLERAREFGVLKAIGANTRQLVSTVFTQSYLIAGIGFSAGIGLAYLVSILVARLSPEILILIEPRQWLSQLPVLVIVTGVASLLPVQRIRSIDPLIVFKA